MANNPKFSSTMRIDLMPDEIESASSGNTKESQPTECLQDDKHLSVDDLKMVGSSDFRALLQSIYDASIITNLDGYIIRCNERAAQFFKYSAEQFIGLHFTSLISGADEMLINTIFESLKNDRFILIQAFCERTDGTLFPAEVSANLIKIDDQDYLCLFIRDVTLRRESEDRLRTGHAAIQNSGNGIAITDMEATLEYYNPAMIKLLGANEANQLNETNITSFLHDINIGDIIISSVANGKVWSGELEMICMNDETIFVQASVAPNTNADGNIIGMVWSILDISKQKRVQQELQERNSQMEEDLSLAREFQQAFIRADYPAFPPGVDKDESILEFGHVYLPSGAVGGDFFEIFAVSENKLGVFISDVMGHGVRSALVVATIRGLIEELGELRLDPKAFITHMNRDLTRIIKHHGHVTFATAFYMVLDLITGKITYTSAGHPAPFLLHSKSETVDMLPFEEGKLGPALGIFDSTVYEATVCQMEAGDGLILYTDGIFEAENEEICECYEIERVAQTLQQNIKETPSDLVDILINKVHEFCDSEYFDDDVCLIGVRLKSLLDSSELKLNL